MPRTSRIAVPDFPHHLYQRGHNGRDVFFGDCDFMSYLDSLAEFRTALGLKVYGYCLMTNHVHLIVDPGPDVTNLGKLMKRLAGRHTRRINHLQGRSGTLWGGRFKCSPIETDRYLLACLRYVDRNPVRARMVPLAGGYRWSSYRAHIGERVCDWLDIDPVTIALSGDTQRRAELYRKFVAEGDEELELRHIRNSLQRGSVTACEAFATEFEQGAGTQLPRRNRGRPVSSEKKTGAEAPVIVTK